MKKNWLIPDYLHHDQAYQAKRMAGLPGWDSEDVTCSIHLLVHRPPATQLELSCISRERSPRGLLVASEPEEMNSSSSSSFS
jgi:hypothetical protein